MKRLLVCILAFLYFAMSSGFVLNVHYCKGKIKSVDVALVASQLCECKKKTKTCCKTQQTVVKLSDKHQAAEKSAHCPVPKEVAIVPTVAAYTYAQAVVSTKHTVACSYVAPLLSHTPLYVQYGVFRI
jgi:hypothetical protein